MASDDWPYRIADSHKRSFRPSSADHGQEHSAESNYIGVAADLLGDPVMEEPAARRDDARPGSELSLLEPRRIPIASRTRRPRDGSFGRWHSVATLMLACAMVISLHLDTHVLECMVREI